MLLWPAEVISRPLTKDILDLLPFAMVVDLLRRVKQEKKRCLRAVLLLPKNELISASVGRSAAGIELLREVRYRAHDASSGNRRQTMLEEKLRAFRYVLRLTAATNDDIFCVVFLSNHQEVVLPPGLEP